MAEIIKATSEHINALVMLFDAYRVFYKKASDTASAGEFLIERLQKNDSEIFLCIDDNGNAVGFTQLYPIFSSTRMKRLWLLNDLYVDTDHRGKGYAAMLLDRAKQLCIETNAAGLILETAKDNVANNLYINQDFIRDDEHNYYSWDVKHKISE